MSDLEKLRLGTLNSEWVQDNIVFFELVLIAADVYDHESEFSEMVEDYVQDAFKTGDVIKLEAIEKYFLFLYDLYLEVTKGIADDLGEDFRAIEIEEMSTNVFSEVVND